MVHCCNKFETTDVELGSTGVILSTCLLKNKNINIKVFCIAKSMKEI